MTSFDVQLDRYQPSMSHQHALLCTYYVRTMVYRRYIIGWCLDYVSQTSCHRNGSCFKMVPKEMNFFVPGAQGNTGTCTALGFLITAGVTAVMAAYNCSICLYYLSIIRYNKKDEYTWYHGISILIIPLVCGFIGFMKYLS
jgi:hypothetical protein